MKKAKTLTAFILTLAVLTNAEYIEGVNWADEVFSCTNRIQSWADGQCGGPGPNFISLQTPQTSWWVLGQSDCDGNGNMQAWDFEEGDRDYAAGWRGGSQINAGQEIVVYFENSLEDNAGADLVIRLYCGPAAKASVYAGQSPDNLVQIGEIEGKLNDVPGKGGHLYDAEFDFSGKISQPVHFVKVFRETVGSQTGMFFDSFRSSSVKLPEIKSEAAQYGWTIPEDANSDCFVNHLDFAEIAESWKICFDPKVSGFEDSVFEDPNSIPSGCHGVWQAGYGLQADINKDCVVDFEDLLLFAENFLTCTDPNNEDCLKPWNL
ncbi:hypothetical protein [Sedimentisphaera salicampi]|uniref:Uncharacterized protein n=1 Tax=Sedimentisphaera salicampi TaxID=1941349 RepID=A0A1W6LJE8_9BACT|nr:hypothetical protein [Sedimentisphaera salicampi]ARN55920.1 hypothetical protein STSP1_00287 [Sedimentisphaera salicampi]